MVVLHRLEQTRGLALSITRVDIVVVECAGIDSAIGVYAEDWRAFVPDQRARLEEGVVASERDDAVNFSHVVEGGGFVFGAHEHLFPHLVGECGKRANRRVMILMLPLHLGHVVLLDVGGHQESLLLPAGQPGRLTDEEKLFVSESWQALHTRETLFKNSR